MTRTPRTCYALSAPHYPRVATYLPQIPAVLYLGRLPVTDCLLLGAPGCAIAAALVRAKSPAAKLPIRIATQVCATALCSCIPLRRRSRPAFLIPKCSVTLLAPLSGTDIKSLVSPPPSDTHKPRDISFLYRTTHCFITMALKQRLKDYFHSNYKPGEARLLQKIDFFILTFCCLSYFVNYVRWATP
jgi:hypothetical protein